MNEPTIPMKTDGEVPRMPALTDDMIARLDAGAGVAMDMMGKVQASGLDQAIPTLARMVANGDLERVSHLARVYAAAEDAVTDEMVTRLTDAVGGGLALMDQVQRETSAHGIGETRHHLV